MEAGEALLGLVIFAAVLAIVLRPLAAGPSSRNRARNRSAHRSALARRMDEHARLLEQRNAVYAAIRGLDFDHATGKLSNEEHARQRAGLVAQGVAILKQLDRLEAAASAADPLEEAIAAMRRGGAQAGPASGAEAASSSAAPASDGHFTCPACGALARHGDRFCGACGQSLEVACTECGAPHRPGDLFCARCGAALEVQG